MKNTTARILEPTRGGIEKEEQMTIVIVGHVDHGKSTVIGRLLADTRSLPEGKLEQVKRTCERNARPFEYAFLLDALKDEQAQGITIDSARVFFKTQKRRYIIFDAPGHIEFLKNMVTGAAHAQAALLVIDAHEGIKENSRRHGYLLSMLGVRQVSILVNKMDLVGWSKEIFDGVVKQYSEFLFSIGVKQVSFIPISAFHGDNLTENSSSAGWYSGLTVLQQLDAFNVPRPLEDLPLRYPVQDIYKFTEEGDERRIVAGTIESGTVCVGEDIVFLPSNKTAGILSIEEFSRPPADSAHAGQAVGVTLDTQLYIKPGEIMVKKTERNPCVSTRFKANLFWLGKAPLIKNKRYYLKLSTARVPAQVSEIYTVIDAAELSTTAQDGQVNTNEVAEIVVETEKPIAFDLAGEIEATTRFVIIDNYEISGGGIITEALKSSAEVLKEHVRQREFIWVRGEIRAAERQKSIGHGAAFVLVSGPQDTGKIAAAKAIESVLVKSGYNAYYLGVSNLLCGLDADLLFKYEDKGEHLRRLGELAHIMTDSGLIFIATASDIDEYDLARLRTLAEPVKTLAIHFGKEGTGALASDGFFLNNPSIDKVTAHVVDLLRKHDIVP